MRPDGVLGDSARVKLAELLRVDGDEMTGRMEVTRGHRDTLSTMGDVWTQAGLRPPLATEMLFCKSSSGLLHRAVWSLTGAFSINGRSSTPNPKARIAFFQR